MLISASVQFLRNIVWPAVIFYRKVVYKSRYLCAVFLLFGAASEYNCGFYLRAAYMQSLEFAKPVKAVWDTV